MSYTLTESDVVYVSFYLMDEDPLSGSLTYHTLSGADSIVFRMRKYGATANAIEATMAVVDASQGYCRVLVTVPSAGIYESEVEVYEGAIALTWVGPTFHVREELG